MHIGPKVQIHKDNKNTKPQKTEIHSQGHKTLMYQTIMHARSKAQNNRDQKNIKPWKTKIHFQGHKILMYGTKVHARPEWLNPQGQIMHLMPCHISFNTFWYTIQGVHII
jgi:hypothetical protein